MKDAEDVQAIIRHAVKGEVIADDDMPHARTEIVSPHAGMRVFTQQRPSVAQRTDEADGGDRITLPDIGGDRRDIGGGARAEEPVHSAASPRAAMASYLASSRCMRGSPG